MYALENHIELLAEDHRNAELLGQELSQIEELLVDTKWFHTNMVFATLLQGDALSLTQHLHKNGIIVSSAKTLRFVTHHQISRDNILSVVEAIKQYYASL